MMLPIQSRVLSGTEVGPNSLTGLDGTGILRNSETAELSVYLPPIVREPG